MEEQENSLTPDKALEVGQQLGETSAKLEETEEKLGDQEQAIEELQFDRAWVELEMSVLRDRLVEVEAMNIGLRAYCEVLEEDIEMLLAEGETGDDTSRDTDSEHGSDSDSTSDSTSTDSDTDPEPKKDETTKVESRKKDSKPKKKRSWF